LLEGSLCIQNLLFGHVAVDGQGASHVQLLRLDFHELALCYDLVFQRRDLRLAMRDTRQQQSALLGPVIAAQVIDLTVFGGQGGIADDLEIVADHRFGALFGCPCTALRACAVEIGSARLKRFWPGRRTAREHESPQACA
jgi:hypothetical protein